MGLIEKLERAAREIDLDVKASLVRASGYDQKKADLRELLEEAARELRANSETTSEFIAQHLNVAAKQLRC